MCSCVMTIDGALFSSFKTDDIGVMFSPSSTSSVNASRVILDIRRHSSFKAAADDVVDAVSSSRRGRLFSVSRKFDGLDRHRFGTRRSISLSSRSKTQQMDENKHDVQKENLQQFTPGVTQIQLKSSMLGRKAFRANPRVHPCVVNNAMYDIDDNNSSSSSSDYYETLTTINVLAVPENASRSNSIAIPIGVSEARERRCLEDASSSIDQINAMKRFQTSLHNHITAQKEMDEEFEIFKRRMNETTTTTLTTPTTTDVETVTAATTASITMELTPKFIDVSSTTTKPTTTTKPSTTTKPTKRFEVVITDV
uniref:Uncharacterized protein n=1 Tax=Strigamia maritima TaxID=126957 RepID=T1IM61_STRMM